MDLKIIGMLLLTLRCVQGQFFEDRRCRCVCPNPATVLNTTSSRQIFTGNVPPRLCHCEGVVFPLLKAELEGKLHIFCPRCECIYQTRNTTLIMNCSLIQDTASSLSWQAACHLDVIRVLVSYDVTYCIVVFILMGIIISVLYMMSFSGLRMFMMRARNYRHGDRHLDRPPERDYIREHRGEFQRERQRELEQQLRQRELEQQRERERELEREINRHRNRAVRDGSPGSDEEELLRAVEPDY